MPKAIPNPQPPRNHGSRPQEMLELSLDQANHFPPNLDNNPLPSLPGASSTDPLFLDIDPRNRQDASTPGSAASPFAGGSNHGDLSLMERLVGENRQLRSIVAEMKQQVEGMAGTAEEAWGERQAEYESLLDEKSDLIRTLHLKVQEHEQRPPPPPATPKEEELLAMSEDLERERCQIDQERRLLEEDVKQLKEDEKSMTEQMRQMEVQMARERAELARQRHDLQQILEEIRHELDRIERDGGLNEKLGRLRQRYQEVVKRKGTGPGAEPVSSPTPLHGADRGAAGEKAASGRKDSGLIRRLFR